MIGSLIHNINELVFEVAKFLEIKPLKIQYTNLGL